MDDKVTAFFLFNGHGHLGQFYFNRLREANLVQQTDDEHATDSNIPIDNIDQDDREEGEDFDSPIAYK